MGRGDSNVDHKDRSPIMAACERCGNIYDKTFTVIDSDGTSHTFDCFECAINSMAPICDHCENIILGHGLEADGAYYCCAHCARHSGVEKMSDRTNEVAHV
jgi:hypothetical protein